MQACAFDGVRCWDGCVSGGHLRGGYLREWTRSHTGVEAFVEPRTAVTETTMLLVAPMANGPAPGGVCAARRQRPRKRLTSL
jgi:hypothetical protein